MNSDGSFVVEEACIFKDKNTLLIQTKSPFQLVHWEPLLSLHGMDTTISFPHYNDKEFELTCKVHKTNGSYKVVKRVVCLEKN